LSDELDDTEDGVSEDGDDDASADSTDSLGQHVKSSDEAIPGDAFEVHLTKKRTFLCLNLPRKLGNLFCHHTALMMLMKRRRKRRRMVGTYLT
jgi:hypothetical protein